MSAPAVRPQALWIGPRHGVEWLEIWRALARHWDERTVATVDEGARILSDRGADLIVLACPRRGMWAVSEVESLHRLAPLAQLVAIHGPWGAGQERSDPACPGVIDWYLSQAPWRLAELAAGQWRSPRTETMAERIERLAGSTSPAETTSANIVLVSASNDGFTAWGAAVAALGATPRWWERDGSPEFPASESEFSEPKISAILWEGPFDEPQRRVSLGALVEQFPAAPVVALLGWPRAEDREALAELGVHRIVSTPALLPDLAAALGWR